MERDEAEFAEGCETARRDVAAGRLVYYWRGHAGHRGHWIATQLTERFGVDVDGLGICFVSRIDFHAGYNSIIVAEIDRRHGDGTFDDLMAEAWSQSESTLGDARRSWMERNGWT
jgi:hypothetical protein